MIQRKYMKKRTICAMIAAIMAMGTVLTPVFAEETDTEPGSVQEETMQSEAASIQETEEQAVPESEQAENLEEEDAKEDEQENHAEPEITEDIGAQLEQDSDLTETVSETEAAKSEEQAEAEIEALYAQKTQEIHLDIADFDKSTGVVYLAKGGISYSAKSSGDGKISYSSSNPSIFTVDKNGKVMPKSGGTADLTIKAAATKNYKEAVKTIRITVNPKPYPTYIHTDPIVVYLGHAPVKLTAETLEYGKKGIEYVSVDSDIARVNKDGTVSFLKPGYTAVNAYVPETETTLESWAGGHKIKVLYKGFYREDGKLYYYDDSYLSSKGWNTINGFKYYMNSEGVIQNGWKTIGGKKYYFWTKTEKGHYSNTMATGWNTINGFKYYMGKDGVIRSGFQNIGGKQYYFWPKTEKGHYSRTMATGWNTINGFKYYMGKDGAIRTGWQTIGGKKYYFWPKTEKGHYKGTLRK